MDEFAFRKRLAYFATANSFSCWYDAGSVRDSDLKFTRLFYSRLPAFANARVLFYSPAKIVMYAAPEQFVALEYLFTRFLDNSLTVLQMR